MVLEKCVYMDYEKDECHILSEKVCEYKRCTFYTSIIEYERNKGRDYLYESFLSGAVSEQRYIDLCKAYPACNRTLLRK
jgi:NurA-like 5'-3' nuclease